MNGLTILGTNILSSRGRLSCLSERTTCSICYYSPTTAFKLSVNNGDDTIVGWDVNCGVPGLGVDKGGAYDYITIPNGQCDYPSTIATAVITVSNDRYCGTAFTCAETATKAGANTICTNHRPFKIGVYSDNAEYAFPAAKGEGTLANNKGFSISYFQKTECQRKTI